MIDTLSAMLANAQPNEKLHVQKLIDQHTAHHALASKLNSTPLALGMSAPVTIETQISLGGFAPKGIHATRMPF